MRLTRRDRLGEKAAEFSRFVAQLFSFRRKTLKKALAQAGYAAEQMLTQTQLDPQARRRSFLPKTF